MESLNKKTVKETVVTGAKKVGAALSLIVLLAMPQKAKADVPAENIIGDLNYEEDRSQVKLQDANDVRNFVSSISEERIAKAIELSDALNAYFFSPLYFTNTTKYEIFNLNIDGLYDAYTATLNSSTNNAYEEFCSTNQVNKPAIDAYTLFGCGKLVENIKEKLANKVLENLANNGYTVSYPSIIVNGSEVYALVSIDAKLEKITLHGDAIDNLVSLNNRYQTAINNIAGLADTYENSFAYNGVDSVSLDSAWLSMGDDYRKEDLKTGLNNSKDLNDIVNFDISVDSEFGYEALTEEEKTTLRSLGYDEQTISTATKRNMYICNRLDMNLSK